MKDFMSNFDGDKALLVGAIVCFFLGIPIVTFILLGIRYCHKKTTGGN